MGKEDSSPQHEIFADESVDTRLIEYQESITEAIQDFVFLARLHTTTSELDLLMMHGATNALITAILGAHHAGIDCKLIVIAIESGIQRPEPQTTVQTQPYQDAIYWQQVQREAEDFWAKRYTPDAPDEW